MQIKFVAVFAALVAVVSASNGGCPHPEEAKNLILEQVVIAGAPDANRHIEHIELPRELVDRTDLSCITVVANRPGATPDFVSFGRNRMAGYSVILHSAIRNPLNVTLFIYTQ